MGTDYIKRDYTQRGYTRRDYIEEKLYKRETILYKEETI